MSKIKLIPIAKTKIPLVKNWQTSTEDFELNGDGVGLVCGKLSDGVEGIDVDSKYDLTGQLWTELKEAINEADRSILPLMTVQKTRNGGYHMIYRCSEIDGNLKLAQRPANEEEAAIGEKVKVLIETRGEGGYFAVAPTEGYEVIYGDLNDLKTITPEQRTSLMEVCRSFNELVEERKPTTRQVRSISDTTPFDEYNEKADVVSLLEKHGWSVVKQKGAKTLMKRPGTTSAATSGNWDEDKGWFTVFTTSTEFQPQTAYRPYAVYAILECGGDWNEAAKQLYAEGYGDRMERTQQQPAQDYVQPKITAKTPVNEFVAAENDYAEYLEMCAAGTLPMGKTTGIPEFDNHWLFKPATFVIINGHDNVGKSVVIWYMMLLGALYHDLKSIIYTGENSHGFVVRKLSEFYWGDEYKGMPETKRKEALKFIQNHFIIIKNREELYNYKDVIEMFKVINKSGDYDMAMIDPYNSLDVPVGVNEHSYHYKAVNELKQFGAANKLSIFINCHAVTGALRALDADKYVQPPQKADTEGGGKFSNKADDFWTIHRIVDHPDEWMVTDIYIRKIKETETGGKPTTKGSPIRLKAKMHVTGFESFVNGFDPVQYWHNVRKGNYAVINDPKTGEKKKVIPEWVKEPEPTPQPEPAMTAHRGMDFDRSHDFGDLVTADDDDDDFDIDQLKM